MWEFAVLRCVVRSISKFIRWFTPWGFSLFRYEWSDEIVGNLNYVHVGYMTHGWLGGHRKFYALVEPYISIRNGGVDDIVEAKFAVARGRDGLYEAFPIDCDTLEGELEWQRTRGNLKEE